MNQFPVALTLFNFVKNSHTKKQTVKEGIDDRSSI